MCIKIACLSDTHGFFDERLSRFIDPCDEIWHAGDIGSIGVAERLRGMKPFRAVYGNIDGPDIRMVFPLHQRFNVDGLLVWITHIGGYPGRYDPKIRLEIMKSPPDIFVCGHSHILKVMNDQELGLLHINPGAAGRAGIHKVQTAIRFEISGRNIHDLEVLELQKK